MIQSKTAFIFMCLLILVSPTYSQIDKSEYYGADKTPLDTFVTYQPDFPLVSALLQTGTIITQFDCYGTFGNGFARTIANPAHNPSFESPPLSYHEFLFAGAIWVGGIVNGDTLVSVGADGWAGTQEFKPPRYPSEGSVKEIKTFADYALTASFIDTITAGVPNDYFGRPHVPMNLKITTTPHIFYEERLNNVIFYDVSIENIGEEVIHDGFVGFFTDSDVGSRIGPNANIIHRDDNSGSLADQMVAFTFDNDGDPVNQSYFDEFSTRDVIASKVIATSSEATIQNFNWWVSDVDPTKDFGPRKKGTPENPYRDFTTGGLGTPEGDRNKYYVLSHPEWDYDQVRISEISEDDPVWMYPNPSHVVTWATGLDTRYLQSFGPFELAPDSTYRFIYAMMIGHDLHQVPDNFYNLANHNIDEYVSNLSFDDLLATIAAADTMAEYFFNPYLQAPKPEIVFSSNDSVVVSWVQWESNDENDIEGYDIYLREIDLSELPYYGVIPPWLTTDETNLYQSIEKKNSFTFHDLNPNKVYVCNVVYRTESGIGLFGNPVHIGQFERDSAPHVQHPYLFHYPEYPVRLKWSSEKTNIDHFAIYKFENKQQADAFYYPFYATSNSYDDLVPKDSFDVDGTRYFYYQMDPPYAEVPANVYEFEDFDYTDSTRYLITSISENSYESEKTLLLSTVTVSLTEKDVMVIINNPNPTQNFTSFQQKTDFYNSILYDRYSYDIFNVRDSSSMNGCFNECIKVLDLSKYKTVIVDDDALDYLLNQYNEKQFLYYSLNGGTIVNCGTLRGYEERSPTAQIITQGCRYDFTKDYLGIDSISYLLWMQYLANSYWQDTVFSFSWAEPVNQSLPPVHLDTSVNYFQGIPGAGVLYPIDCPLQVATFSPNSNGEVLYRYRSLYPNESIFEDLPIGIRTRTQYGVNYQFGFHLYYMKQQDASNLIDFIIADIDYIPEPIALPNYDSVYTFWANALEPMTFKIDVTNLFDFEHEISDFSSIRINDNLVPTTATLNPNHPIYFGDVLELELPMREFILSYGLLHSYVDTTFIVSGEYDDGTPFEVTGDIIFRAHIYGDLDGSMSVDISDMVYFVDHMWRGGPPPDPISRGDLNNNQTVDIGDVVALIDFMFH